MTGTEFRMLGGFTVKVDGASVPPVAWARRHAASLVKLLALSERHRLHREQVVTQLWPALSLEEAAPRLHKAAHFARKALERTEVTISLRSDIVALEPADLVTTDVGAFRTAARQAIAEEDAERAEAALALYGGDLLPDDIYEEWAAPARDELRELQRTLLRIAGRWTELAELDPADEEAQVAVARRLIQQGDHRAALRQLERLERALQRELGADLGPPARALKQELSGRVAVAAPRAPVPAPTRLIGRREIAERLRARIESAAEGRGGVMLLRGPAGVGKTALLDLAVAGAARRDFRIARWTASAVESQWPYGPVMAALGRLCRSHPALLDGLGDPLREEIEVAMAAGDLTWTGEAAHSRLFVATSELLRVASAGGGLLVVIDDVHEADEASLSLLHYLARFVQDEAVLLLLAGRPGGAHDDEVQSIVAHQGDLTVEITPLPAAAIERLLADAHPELPVSLVTAIAQASAGLPFTALELARRRTTSAAGQPFSALAPAAMRPLRRLALLGTTFMTDEFLAMSDVDTDAAYAQLGQAVGAMLIEPTETGYRFRHPMLRDSIVEAIPPHELASEQREVATRLSALGAAPARVARLLLDAAQPAQAVPYVVRAVDKAGAVGAYRDALDLVDRVIDHAPPTERAHLLARRADLLFAIGSPETAEAYRTALAVTTGTEHRLARARLARVLAYAGDLDSAEAALGDQAPEGDAADAPTLLARGTLAYFRGDLDSAWLISGQARDRVDLGDVDWQILDLATLQGLIAHHRGDAFGRFRMELRRTSGRESLATSVFDAHLCVAEYVLYGDMPYDEVISYSEELRTASLESGAMRGTAFATALIGEAALLKGDLDRAEKELSEAIALHRDISATGGEAHSMQRLAEVKLARGRLDEANELLHDALPLARWSVLSPHLLQRIYGAMITAAPDPDVARSVVDRATAVMTDADRCIVCDVMLAVPAAIACARVGDLEEAHRQLGIAQESAVRFEGPAWTAAVAEARAHVAAAEGSPEKARALFGEADRLFRVAGQLRDADRCRDALVTM